MFNYRPDNPDEQLTLRNGLKMDWEMLFWLRERHYHAALPNQGLGGACIHGLKNHRVQPRSTNK